MHLSPIEIRELEEKKNVHVINGNMCRYICMYINIHIYVDLYVCRLTLFTMK